MQSYFKAFLAAVVGVASFASASVSHAYVSYTYNGSTYSAPVVRDVAFTPGLEDVTFLLSAPIPEGFYMVFELSREVVPDPYVSEGLLTSEGEQYPVYKNFNKILTQGYGRYRMKAAVCAKRTDYVHQAGYGIGSQFCSKPYYETFDYYKHSNHISAYDEAGTYVNYGTVNNYGTGMTTYRRQVPGNTSSVTTSGCATARNSYTYKCPTHNGTRVGYIARTSLPTNTYNTYQNVHQPTQSVYVPRTSTKYVAARPYTTTNTMYQRSDDYRVALRNSRSNPLAQQNHVAFQNYQTPMGAHTASSVLPRTNTLASGSYYQRLPEYAQVTDRDAYYESMFSPKFDVGSQTSKYTYNGQNWYGYRGTANGY